MPVLPNPPSLADGAATATLTVTPINDPIVEPVESITVSLVSDPNTPYQTGTPASATVQLLDDESDPTVFASAENTISGTITSGSMTSLQAADGSVETLTEYVTGGKVTQRQSYLDHRWTFDLGTTPATSFQVVASHTTSMDNEDFRFEYSKNNGVSWTPLTTVTGTTMATYTVPNLSIIGSLILRVVDTDQTVGKYAQDSVIIDRLLFGR